MTGPIRSNQVCGRGRPAEYRLIAPLGDRGGEGQVWQAEYLAPQGSTIPFGLTVGDTIALKILNPENVHEIDEFEQRWRRVADFYGDQDWHPNLVRIYGVPFRGKLPHHPDDYFETGADTLYLAMEYLQGQSLRDNVLSGSNGEPVPFSLRRNYVQALVSVADGLSALGKVRGQSRSGSLLSKRTGLVHRDVKPDNIIFPPGRTPVLVDFGSMREMFTSRMYSGISGTAGYMAPEVADHSVTWELRATPAVDLYGFACVIYFTLTASEPPVQQSRWRHHFDTFLTAPGMSEVRILLEEVLLEDDPERRLAIDVAEWSRRIARAIAPMQAPAGPSPWAPDQKAPDRAAPATPSAGFSRQHAPKPDRKPITASSSDTRAEVDTPSEGRSAQTPKINQTKNKTTASPGHKRPQRRTRSASSSGKGSKGGTSTSRRPVGKGAKSSSKYIYLNSRGKVTHLPSLGKDGEIRRDVSNAAVTFTVTKHHISDSLMKEGGTVRFKEVPGYSRASHVSRSVTRFIGPDPVPFVEIGGAKTFFYGGIITALVAYVSHSSWEASTSALWYVVYAIFAMFLTGSMQIWLSACMPDGGYRTWWEEHHFIGLTRTILWLAPGILTASMIITDTPWLSDSILSLTGGDRGIMSVIFAFFLIIAPVLLAGLVVSASLYTIYVLFCLRTKRFFSRIWYATTVMATVVATTFNLAVFV